MTEKDQCFWAGVCMGILNAIKAGQTDRAIEGLERLQKVLMGGTPLMPDGQEQARHTYLEGERLASQGEWA